MDISSAVQMRARAVRLAIFDVDGVLTDGRLYFDPEGREHKVFDVKDGHGVVMLRHAGIVLAVLSARSSPAVARRMADLSVEHVVQGRRDKLAAFEELLATLGISSEHTAFVADDLVDLPVFVRVGFAVAVQDAHSELRSRAHWVTPSKGGRGAVREFCELLLHAQGRWEAALEAHLR